MIQINTQHYQDFKLQIEPDCSSEYKFIKEE